MTLAAVEWLRHQRRLRISCLQGWTEADATDEGDAREDSPRFAERLKVVGPEQAENAPGRPDADVPRALVAWVLEGPSEERPVEDDDLMSRADEVGVALPLEPGRRVWRQRQRVLVGIELHPLRRLRQQLIGLLVHLWVKKRVMVSMTCLLG
jgi:hypothetical protein